MTRIGSSGTGSSPSTDAAQARRDRGETSRDPFRDPRRDGGQNAFGSNRDLLGRRDPGSDGMRGRGKAGQGAKDGQRDSFAGVEASGSSFQRLVEERMQDGEGRRDPGHHEEQDRDDQVLAVAEPGPDVPVGFLNPLDQPLPASAPPTLEGAPLVPVEVNRMVAIAERVDAALRLDRMAEARGEGTFRLVGEAACGLDSVAVSLSSASLDVTLTHAFTASPADIVQAATLLAQQLQDRFPTKRVRILQAAQSVDTASSGMDGLTAIGRWLSGPAS